MTAAPLDNQTVIETRSITPGEAVSLPSGEFVANASFVREGNDLQVSGPDGRVIVVEDYFAQGTPPELSTPDGAVLTPELVDAFLPPQHVGAYAQNGATASDASPAGQITEIVGTVTITRADGTKVDAKAGTPVFAGDVVETSADGAANILFADNTTFAISESARLSVDEFVYNAAEQEGSSFFSMLQGVFVYTSGLIGKNDPGNVNIDTPVGSIGIRGTVVAGKIAAAGQASEITIVDGAIVVSNRAGTVELNDSFETARLFGMTSQPENIGQVDASSFSQSYSSISNVAGESFRALSNGSNQGNQNNSNDGGDATSPTGTDGDATDGSGEQGMAPAPTLNTDQASTTQSTTLAGDAATGVVATLSTDASQTTTSTTSTTGTGDASTTTSGVTQNVAPPPPPPPPPLPPTGSDPRPPIDGTNVVRFNFSPLYTKNTPMTGDDGIPLFGGSLNSTGQTIGTAVLLNPQLPPGATITYHLTYFDPSTNTTVTATDDTDIMGSVYRFNTVTTPDPYDQIVQTNQPYLHFDAQTGAMTIMDPTGLDQRLNNNMNFSITAMATYTDAGGTQTIQLGTPQSFVLRTDPSGPAGGAVFLGSASSEGITVGFNGMGDGGIDLSGRPMGSTAYTDAGNDRVKISTAGGMSAFMGAGDDLVVLTGGMNFNRVDGGMGNDRVVMQGNYDFIANNTPKMFNIEQISLTTASTLTLSLQDIFEITGPTKTLFVNAFDPANGGQGNATLFLDLAGMTPTGTLNLGAVSATGNLTLQGQYNGQTVTLVVDQGSVGDGITIAAAT